jgi:cellulose synthase/poly-beta-1,6-N-acetylglucosamine synthase-like glycosyltransferase
MAAYLWILLGVEAAALAYAWVLFPVLVSAVARRARAQAAPAAAEPPTVAVLFSAHDEEAVIRERLANLDQLDYPRDRLRVLVGADGCTDRTVALAREWAAAHPHVTLLEKRERGGKLATVKELVREADREPGAPAVLVLTDANTHFAPDALRRLTDRLADPLVGGVCGRLVFRSAGGATDEGAYWDWESRLKEAESRLDSCLGANGAIYAVRRERFPRELPDNVIVDDFVIGMKIREGGARVVFEPAALAYEDAPAAVRDEWRRRVRIGAGAYQALGLCRRCLLPRYGAFAWLFFSHKVLRWITPHLLLAWFAAALCLGFASRSWPAWLPLAGAAAGLAAAAVSRKLRYFLAMQAALFAGFLRYCRGDLKGHWRRTPRVRGERP